MSHDKPDKNPWRDDHIGRSKEADMLKTFLLRRVDERANLGGKRSYVLNLDAQWGTGKTFFLQRFAEQLKDEGFIVAQVNAWEDDHADDPLIPVLAAIEKALEPHLGTSSRIPEILTAIRISGVEIAASLARHSLEAFASKFVGRAVQELPEILDGQKQKIVEESISEGATLTIRSLSDKASKSILSRYWKDKETATLFRTKLTALTETLGRKRPNYRQIFVFVDELDRCRPTYAIETLERVKHLFDTNGIVFVIATDTTQLQHSIQAVYGSGFDSAKYLQRFFDRQYRFRKSTILSFIKQVRQKQLAIDRISVPPVEAKTSEDSFDIFFARTVQGFDLGLRETNKVFEIFSDFVSVWNHASKVEAIYLLPLICAKLKSGIDLYQYHDSLTLVEMMKSNMLWELVNRPDRRGQLCSHNAFEFFSALHERRKMSLPDIPSTFGTEPSTPEAWARGRFIEEFQLNYKNQCKANETIRSTLLEYPAGIESVEHLSS